MARLRLPLVLFLFVALAPVSRGQLGKSVLIPAGSEADHQLSAINAASEPAEKLKLIDQFAQAHENDDLAIVANEQYVAYYLNAKQYDKVFAYGDKLFALDPNNYSNAVNMIRAANEKGDADRIFNYGEKTGGILQRYKDLPPPAGVSQDNWQFQKSQTLASLKDNQEYIEQSVLNAAYQLKDPTKKAEQLERFASAFPDSPNAPQALSVAAFSYQQAQNRTKMMEAANKVLAKDPNNIGMLLLLADDYSERNEQLDKAGEYAKKAISLCDAAQKPEGVADDQWKQQISLQKGLALSTLGQVSLEKKQNDQAVDNLTKAAPLLKSNAMGFARNQYRLGYAYLNLKKNAEAKQAFTDAASVNSPYKGKAEEKLKAMTAAKRAAS